MAAPHALGVLGVARSIRITTDKQASPLVMDFEGVRAVGYSVPGAQVETIGIGNDAPVHATTQDAVVLLFPQGDVPLDELAEDAPAIDANAPLAAVEAGAAEAVPAINANNAVPHDVHELEEGEIRENALPEPMPPTPASWLAEDAYELPAPDVESAHHLAATHERSALMDAETSYFDPSTASEVGYYPASVATPYSAFGGISYPDSNQAFDSTLQTPVHAAPTVNTVLAPDDSVSILAYEDPARYTMRALPSPAYGMALGLSPPRIDSGPPSDAGHAMSGIGRYANAAYAPQAIPPPTWSTPAAEPPRTIDPRRAFHPTVNAPMDAPMSPIWPPAVGMQAHMQEERRAHIRSSVGHSDDMAFGDAFQQEEGAGTTHHRLENLPRPLPSSVRNTERDMHDALHPSQPNRSARRAMRARRPSPFMRPAAPRLSFAEPAALARRQEKSRWDPPPVAGPSRTPYAPPAHNPYPRPQASRPHYEAVAAAGPSRTPATFAGSSQFVAPAADRARQQYCNAMPPPATVYGIATSSTSQYHVDHQPMMRAIHAGAVQSAMSPGALLIANVPYGHFVWVVMELMGMRTSTGEPVRDHLPQRRPREIQAQDGDLFVQYDGRGMTLRLHGRRVLIPMPTAPDSSAGSCIEFGESDNGRSEMSVRTGYTSIPCREIPVVDFNANVAANLAARDPRTPTGIAPPQQDDYGHAPGAQPSEIRVRRILNTLVDYSRTRARANEVLNGLDGAVGARPPPWSQETIWGLRRLHMEAFYTIVSYVNREGFVDSTHAFQTPDFRHLSQILQSPDYPDSFFFEEFGNPFLWVVERRRLAAARTFLTVQVDLLRDYSNMNEHRAMVDLIDYLLTLDIERGYHHELFALRYTNALGLPGYPPDEALQPFRHD